MPSVFRFSSAKEVFRFYVGEFSTAEGLSLFSPNESIHIQEFYLGGSRSEIEIDSDDLSKTITNVRMAMSYFQNNPTIDLVDFRARIGENVNLSTHDDGECSFELESMEATLDLMNRCPGLQGKPERVQLLIENAGCYVSVSHQDETAIFRDFDSYVASVSDQSE